MASRDDDGGGGFCRTGELENASAYRHIADKAHAHYLHNTHKETAAPSSSVCLVVRERREYSVQCSANGRHWRTSDAARRAQKGERKEDCCCTTLTLRQTTGLKERDTPSGGEGWDVPAVSVQKIIFCLSHSRYDALCEAETTTMSGRSSLSHTHSASM